MASALDVQAGIFGQFRLRPVQRLRAFGEAGQHVEFGQRGGAALERLQALVQRIEQLFVQQAFAASERSRADSTLSSNCFSSSVM